MSKNPVSFFIVFIVFSLTFLGCDQISAVFEYFKKPQKQETAAISSTPSAIAQEEINVEKKPSLPANVLAKVGSWTITLEEFNQRLSALKEAIPDLDVNDPETKKLMLEELVRQQLLVWDAERKGVAQQKDILDAIDEFRRTLLVQEVAKKIVENLTATEEEAKEFYDLNKDKIVEPPQWHLREIVVDAQLKANELSVEILKGGDFAEIAKQNSTSETAAQGGDLGTVSEAPFPEMASILTSLNTGDVSSVFKGPKGFYIVKVEEKKGGVSIPFEDIKQEIIDDRTAFKQQQAILEHINKLEKEIKVEKNESLLK